MKLTEKSAFFGRPYVYLIDVLATTTFAYLLLDAMFVLWFGGPFSRINLLGFLIPHASKIALWSAVALFWLRPRFKWRFPFAMGLLYCLAELLTNGIWVVTHLPFGYKPAPDFVILFPLSTIFFVLMAFLCWLMLKGRFQFKKDWAMLPFIVFVGFWIATGYQTESTIPFPTYWLEAEEFIWTAAYLLMVANIFKVKA